MLIFQFRSSLSKINHLHYNIYICTNTSYDWLSLILEFSISVTKLFCWRLLTWWAGQRRSVFLVFQNGEFRIYSSVKFSCFWNVHIRNADGSYRHMTRSMITESKHCVAHEELTPLRLIVSTDGTTLYQRRLFSPSSENKHTLRVFHTRGLWGIMASSW